MGPQRGTSSPEALHRSRAVSTYAWLGILSLMFLIFAVATLRESLAAPGTWSYTQPMFENRRGHTATLLPDGTVLVAGGEKWDVNPSPVEQFQRLSSAEIYYPDARMWTSMPRMHYARAYHTATLLPDGKVLVAGGKYSNVVMLNYAEIYDPSTSSWSDKGEGSMGMPRAYHTATLLPNGKVLVVGGNDSTGATNSAELYDPATHTWSFTGSMSDPRVGHTATLLPDGRVLVAGGRYVESYTPFKYRYLDSAEIYDPVAGTWTKAGSMKVSQEYHTATLLRNGRVLVAGNRAELYDSLLDTWGNAGTGWSSTGTYFDPFWKNQTATLLQDGQVLVAGGESYSVKSAKAWLYDPVSVSWTGISPMNTGRQYHTATVLPNGQVLVAGGDSDSNTTNSAEIYEPEPPVRVSLPPLLAFYPFEGDAQDASGNGRHGMIAHSPQVVAGYEGQAYSFNGGADSITVPLDINPSKYPRLTIGAWAKNKASGSLQPLISHDDGGYDRQIGTDHRGGGFGWSAFCGPTGGVLGAVPAVYDKWTFVAAVYDQAAQTVKLQVDDMVLTKGGVTLDSGETRLYIGGSPRFSSFFSGLVDNVFVFGDALTDRQLAYIRSAGAAAILTAANSNKCAAILYDDLSLHVPAIVLNGQYYWADFQFVQNTMDFVVSNAGLVTDPSPFSGCAASTLSPAFRLHVPDIIYGGVSYWADLQYSQGVRFTLVEGGKNRVVKFYPP